MKFDEYEEFKKYLKPKLYDLKTPEGLFHALRTYNEEQSLIETIDEVLLNMAPELKKSDWIALLNTKSLKKQRNIKLLQACSFNLLNCQSEFTIQEIKTCLLSYGVLNYHDEQLFTRLAKDFCTHLSNDSVTINEEILNIIILSFGMLRLRDIKVLNQLCSYLIKNPSKELIINFTISCGNLNYRPENFEKLLSELSLELFDFNNEKKSLQFINLTWSLCSMGLHNLEFIKTALKEQFWKSVLDG